MAAAAPSALKARTGGIGHSWTVNDFVRFCDDVQNVCTYSFTITDNSGGAQDVCKFSDQVGPDESRSARYSSPSGLKCSEGSPIFVNIGYDQPGNFFVVVPVNTATNTNAFFGYTAAELADNNVVKPDHTSTALTIGEFKKSKKEAAPVALEARQNLGQWTVQHLHRGEFWPSHV